MLVTLIENGITKNNDVHLSLLFIREIISKKKKKRTKKLEILINVKDQNENENLSYVMTPNERNSFEK